MTYEATYWSVSLSPEWAAETLEDCTAFYSEESPVVFLVSAYLKDLGTVSDADLKDFAIDDSIPLTLLRPISQGEFCGFYADLAETDGICGKYFLACKNCMLYITLSTGESCDGRWIEVISSMLNTLKFKR